MMRSLGNPMNDEYEVVVRGPKSRKSTKPRSSKKSTRKTHKKGRTTESRYLRQVRNSRKALRNLMRRRGPMLVPELKPYRLKPFVRLSPPSRPIGLTAADRRRAAEDASYERKMRYELGLERPPLLNVRTSPTSATVPLSSRNTNRSYYAHIESR